MAAAVRQESHLGPHIGTLPDKERKKNKLIFWHREGRNSEKQESNGTFSKAGNIWWGDLCLGLCLALTLQTYTYTHTYTRSCTLATQCLSRYQDILNRDNETHVWITGNINHKESHIFLIHKDKKHIWVWHISINIHIYTLLEYWNVIHEYVF